MEYYDIYIRIKIFRGNYVNTLFFIFFLCYLPSKIVRAVYKNGHPTPTTPQPTLPSSLVSPFSFLGEREGERETERARRWGVMGRSTPWPRSRPTTPTRTVGSSSTARSVSISPQLDSFDSFVCVSVCRMWYDFFLSPSHSVGIRFNHVWAPICLFIYERNDVFVSTIEILSTFASLFRMPMVGCGFSLPQATRGSWATFRKHEGLISCPPKFEIDYGTGMV